jgi:glutamate/tyrosine decarboxylase-like PLP-dependent enzyme
MDSDQLEAAIIKAIENGKTPFFVSATAGTTVMGGFDDFVALSVICKKYKIWLHIDGCWGGSVLMSKKYR